MDMDALSKEMERRSEIADEIMASDPKLSPISAMIMAGDRMSADRATEMMNNGVPYDNAVVVIGSFYRLNWMIQQYIDGKISFEKLTEDWAADWRGSDPDDTDKRYLDVWAKLFYNNKKRYIRDGKPLPRKNILTVYRGQDEFAPFGIAWTLDKAIAEKFANGAGSRQSNRGGIVYVASIERRKVLGYLTLRGESEVIVNPRDLR